MMLPPRLTLKDKKSATLSFSEHLSLLVRDWRGRLLRLEDHGFEDGPFCSVSTEIG